jgi:hypothetical protein
LRNLKKEKERKREREKERKREREKEGKREREKERKREINNFKTQVLTVEAPEPNRDSLNQNHLKFVFRP